MDPQSQADADAAIQMLFDWIALAPPGVMVPEPLILPYTDFSPIVISTWSYQRPMKVSVDVMGRWRYTIDLVRRPIGDRATGMATVYWEIKKAVRDPLVPVDELRHTLEA